MRFGVRVVLFAGFVLWCCRAGVLGADGDAGRLARGEAGARDEERKVLPVSLSVDYALVSDYIFRGINFSEYPGEGREKLNHQLGAGIEIDTGAFGAIGASVWFEWYAAQQRLTPDYSGKTQEVDYAVYWSYGFESLATTVEIGWIAYTFPPFRGDAHSTYELYGKLGFQDGVLWGTESPILSPTIAYYQDIDDAAGSGWFEVGISHDFDMERVLPVMQRLTVTPSLVLGVDHRYFGKLGLTSRTSTRVANLTYGLGASYDLGAALGMPPRYGEFTVGGFVNYSQAFARDAIKDELYGGMTVGYSW